jgi:hypothetical protein
MADAKFFVCLILVISPSAQLQMYAFFLVTAVWNSLCVTRYVRGETYATYATFRYMTSKLTHNDSVNNDDDDDDNNNKVKYI